MGTPFIRCPHFAHATYFIARGSTESYNGAEFPERKLPTGSAGHLSRLSDSALIETERVYRKDFMEKYIKKK